MLVAISSFFGCKGFGSQSSQRPYAENFLSREKKVCNYRLTRARRFTEYTSSLLSNKFKIFDRSLNVSIDIVRCCCVLHNFILKCDAHNYSDTWSTIGLQDLPASGSLISIRR